VRKENANREKKKSFIVATPYQKKFEDGIKKNKIKIKNRRKQKRKMKGANEKRGTYFYCQVF
jgi:hypothetical protein